jgi:tetratricopeptide (TPR) repeat protein
LAFLALGAAALGSFWLRFQAQRDRTEGLRIAQLGRFAEAETLLRRALERKPEDWDVVKALALGYLAANQSSDAETFLGRMSELRPNDAWPFKRRMQLRHRRARAAAAATDRQRLMAEALIDGQSALELDPRDEALTQEVVWLLMQVGRLEEADKLCRDCRQGKPDDPWLIYLMARIDYERGIPAEARELLDGLLRQSPGLMRDPRFAPALLVRAMLYNEAGEPDKAVPLLRQVLSLDRTNSKEARYQLGLALGRLGQNEEAQRIMAGLQKDNLDWLLADAHNPEAPGVKLQQAEALFAAGKEEEALRLITALLEKDPSLAPAHALLASYYEKKGQPERAAKHRRQAEK